MSRDNNIEIEEIKAARIDWDAVYRKIKANQEALDKLFDTDPEHNARVFRQRAERMALRDKAAKSIETVAVMRFKVGAEQYGMLLDELSEIRPFHSWTKVPGTPSEFRGLVSNRGEIRSVIDLGRVIGVTIPSIDEDRGYMLFLKGDHACFALKVSEVNQVEAIEKAKIDEACSQETVMLGRYLRGVDEDSMIFLDLKEILDHPIFKGIS